MRFRSFRFLQGYSRERALVVKALTFILTCLFLTIPCEGRIITVDDHGLCNRDIDFKDKSVTSAELYVDGHLVAVPGGDLYVIGLIANSVPISRDNSRLEYCHTPSVSSLARKGGLSNVGSEQVTYYVDATEGDNTNDGTSPESAFRTIQKAVDSAQDGYTVIVLRGRYVGDGNRDVDFNGKAITVRSEDPNDPNIVAITIIDCNGTPEEPHRGFRFHSGESINSILAGVTIKHGYAPYEVFVGDKRPLGGAIFCGGASPTIVNCIITENAARYGGGVYCNDSSSRIINCIFSNNSASSFGGAICCYWYSNSSIINCTITGNSAGWGGGVELSGETIITSCIINGNSANYGGGIYCNMEPQISNCVISENRAEIDGGGILWNTGTITNCTIANNSVGSGIYAWSNYGATISNCILWNNDFYNDYECTPVVNYCCIQTWSGDVDGIIDWIIDNGNISQDPLFAGPSNNDYHLLPSSPCIDAGDNTAVPPEITTDLEGSPRFVDDPTTVDTGKDVAPIVDMGAYEYILPIYNITQKRCHGTIQEAIDEAVNGDEIFVSPGIYTGPGNRDIDFVGKAITLRSINRTDSSGVGSTVIDCLGSETDPHRGFYFHSGEDANSVLEGFTIINGYGPNEPFGENTYSAGGAVYCIDSSPMIRNCFFANNYSNFWGGGVYCDNSNATLSNCTFKENESFDTGGGLFNRLGSVIVNRCIFIDNSAAYGGGMYNVDSAPAIRNGIFLRNLADGKGGAVRNNRTTSTLMNCTFFDNQAPNGGAIHNVSSDGTIITNCILWGNANDEIEGSASVTYCDIQGGWLGEGIIDADPCFVNQNSGDYHLLPSSPCIDSGDPKYVLVKGETDVDGQPRVSNGRIDIGADEYGIIYVSANSPNDPGNGTKEDPCRNIQDAIDAGPTEIRVAQGQYNESIVIRDDVRLYGGYNSNDWRLPRDPKTNETIINANVYIDGANVEIDGFTITNGLAKAGGGIYCKGSNLKVSNCRITGNRTIDGEDDWDGYGGNGGDGAGIYSDSRSSLAINSCVISDNRTGEGGWGYNGGAGGNGGGIYCSSATITNCKIDRNITGNAGYGEHPSGPGGNGGGIYCAGGIIIVKNCEITQNTTGSGSESECYGSDGGSGAGIYSALPIVENCIIAGNATGAGADGWGIYHAASAGNGGNGGGIFCRSGTLRNCIIVNNTTGDGGVGDQYGAPVDGGNGGCGAGGFGPSEITNCTVANNITGAGGIGGSGGIDGQRGWGTGICANNSTMVNNTIICDNSPDELAGHDCNNVSYCDICDGSCSGANGNISMDPLFADPNNGDYHLKSFFGRWDPNSKTWVYDDVNSPCIDSGNPKSDWRAELWPHGKRINMGAYGGTPQASMSPPDLGNIADLNHDGRVDFADFALFADRWWVEEVLLAEDMDLSGCVDVNDLSILAESWLERKEEGLMGCWSFNEKAGIMAWDSSGYGNTGTLVNGPVWTSQGELCFDGIDDYFEVAASESLDIKRELTVSVWVYLYNYSKDWPKLVIKPYETYSTPWELYCIDLSHYGTYPRFMITDGIVGGSGTFVYNSIHTLSLNQWYHIVGTYDGSVATLYVDGEPVASGQSTLQIGNNAMPISIGGRLGINSFNGVIGEVRIYKRALTKSEVVGLFNE